MHFTFRPSLLAVAALVVATVAHATPVTVNELGIGANQVVKITSSTLSPSGVNVYAGVVNLAIDGTPTPGFCIDPWHWSVSGNQTYEEVPLADAPKDPNTGLPTSGMGWPAARQIEQLWAQYYSPSITNLTAAALQIKIWQIVDNATADGTFSLLTNNASLNSALLGMDTFLANHPDAPTTHLVAVTSAYTTKRAGQDYLIPSVPDTGATALLLALGLGMLVVARRRRAAYQA